MSAAHKMSADNKQTTQRTEELKSCIVIDLLMRLI